MTPEELKRLVGDAKPHTLKEWLLDWKAWSIYREATHKEVSITSEGRRQLATLILLDRFLGPECQDANCMDYDGEHPYHQNIGIRAHEEGQRKLRADLEHAHDRIRELKLELGHKDVGTVTGRLSAAHPNLSNPPKAAPTVFFLNETHELPRTTKKQVRRERDAKRLEKRRDLLKVRLKALPNDRNLTAQERRETEEMLKEDIRRLTKRAKNLRIPKVESMKIEATLKDSVAWALKEKK